MAFDPVKQFLGAEADPNPNIQDVVAGNIDTPAPASSGFGDALGRGIEAGAEGIAGDVEYFKALFNLGIGDKEAALDNVRIAQQSEQAAASALGGIPEFKEFIEEPTIGGFLDQVGKFTGQTAVSVASSIAGGGIGGLVGNFVGKKISKKAAERIVKDSVERTAKGVATPDEKQIAQIAYDYAKRGAYTGAFAAEYVPATASALRDSMESGQELDANTAFRSFLVGAPVAAVGVSGEAAILKLFSNVAAKRAATDGSIFGELARDITRSTSRSAVIEGTTETIQESINVANRASMDDNFTAQEAAMRIGESAFAGFFAGAGLGAAGGAGGSVISNRDKIAESAPVTAVANVVDKARRMIDQAQSQQVESEIDREQYGDIMSGNTTPESQADINAQLKAMIDDTSSKKAVWVAGNNPQFKARERKATEITVDNKLAYAAFIPGRGTIVSTDKQVVDQVIAEQASDTVLAAALGYSSAKDATSPGDTVVQVVDKDGGIVSEEVTDSNGLPEAFNAAQALMPEGGSVKQTTVEKALEERRARAERDTGPVIRDMEDDGTFITPEQEIMAQTGVQAADIQRTEIGAFGKKRDPNEKFATTDSARADYEATFGPTDWSDPFYGQMTEALLQKAVDEQVKKPTFDVRVEQKDGQYILISEGLPVDPTGSSAAFVAVAFNRAKRSKFARNSSVVVVPPNGKPAKVNLVDLTNAGRQLVLQRGDDTYQGDTQFESSKKGLLEILSDLRLEGYDVLINGMSLYDINGPVPDAMNVTAGRADGANVSLKDLMATRQTTPDAKPLVVTAYEVDETGRRTDKIVARQEATPEAADAFERVYTNRGYDVVRTGGEFDPNDVGPKTTDVTELERMQQSGQTGDGPKTRLNTESDPRFEIDRSVGPAPSTGISPPEQMQFADSTVVSFINNLRNALKLRTNLRVYNIDQLLAASDSQLRSMFVSVSDYEKVSQSIRDFRERPKLYGRAINGLNGGSIIILREQANPLRTALTAGHELGHVLFAEHKSDALDSRTLRASLLRTYKKDKLYQNYVNKYGEELGFDEWYADQVAKWASRRYIRQQAKSLSDRHFKQLVDKIRGLYRSLGRLYRQRLTGKVDQQFDQFMDAVLEARRDGKTVGETSFAKKQLAREMERAVVKEGGEALAAHWKKKIASIVNDPNVRPLLKFVRTADGVLRSITGNKVADMFYVRSQDKEGGGDLGFIGAKARKIDDLQNKFERDVGSLSDETTVAAIKEAASSAATVSLSPKAQKVRKFLDDIYVDYIEPSNTNVGRQSNYFPTALELMEVVERGDDFVSLVVAYNPGITPAKAREAVNRLREFNHSMRDDGPVEFNATNPASSVEEARQLTANVPREILQKQGFLQDPREALISYVRHVATRVEWNAHTKDNDGVDILGPELDKLSERDREEANGVIAAYLGYQSKPIGPLWRKVNSYGQFFQFVTILPFATLASLPELAGPLINSKELDFNTFVTAFKEIGASIKNRAESQQFARDIGVVTSEVVANSWVTEAEQDFMDPKVRKMSDWYFKAIGLNWYTKFTREFAAGMGVQFIIRHAENKFDNPRSERYLSELGLTAEVVKKWERSNRRLDTPEGKKVTKALQRFVESSVLRPNAAERPIWASDPRWALVWQLKSFMYAYQKVIVGGVFREMQNRTREDAGTGIAQLTSTTAVLALTAIATMPLAMLALELREYAKYGLAAIIPGADATDRYFRSDRMDWGEYFVEIFDRSGFTGAFAIAGMMNQNAEWGQNPLLPLAGPTAETVDKLIDNGFDITKTVGSRLPISFN